LLPLQGLQDRATGLLDEWDIEDNEESFLRINLDSEGCNYHIIIAFKGKDEGLFVLVVFDHRAMN
jgi:hypothetical protein